MERLFNPLEDLFIAQSDKPTELGEINLRALPPFHRALLVIDGTVTKFIEAYTMDPIEVIPISQNELELPTHHPWLEALENTQIIAREVILSGKYSAQVYAYASSLIIPARLPNNFREDLKDECGGIGQVLISNQLETYREILWYGKERLRKLPSRIHHLENKEFISRTYRVMSSRKPLMLINEKFPIDIELPYF